MSEVNVILQIAAPSAAAEFLMPARPPVFVAVPPAAPFPALATFPALAAISALPDAIRALPGGPFRARTFRTRGAPVFAVAISGTNAPVGRLNAPREDVDIMTSVVLASAKVESDLHTLPGLVAIKQGSLVFHKLHLDVLRVLFAVGRQNELTLRESAAKRLHVHDDLDGSFKFECHCLNELPAGFSAGTPTLPFRPPPCNPLLSLPEIFVRACADASPAAPLDTPAATSSSSSIHWKDFPLVQLLI